MMSRSLTRPSNGSVPSRTTTAPMWRPDNRCVISATLTVGCTETTSWPLCFSIAATVMGRVLPVRMPDHARVGRRNATTSCARQNTLRRWLAGGGRRRELGPPQLGEGAAARQQFVEAAALDDAPGLEHHDLVGLAHRGQAMRDDESG